MKIVNASVDFLFFLGGKHMKSFAFKQLVCTRMTYARDCPR